MSTAPWYFPILGSLLSGLVGALVVYYFGVRQLVLQRKFSFRERQLGEFYAPLAGIRKQILAKSELRLKISNAADAAWQDLCRSYGSKPMRDHDQQFVPYKKIIEYDNEQLKKELVPNYREMLALFTDKYYLAEPETRAFYQEFLEFVEIWNRWLSESLPADVLRKLEHSEEKVKPFYDHLESKMQHLQNELAQR